MRPLLRLLGFSLLGLGMGSAVPAFAQSCALCYTQAASSGARMIQALQSGILILVIPPTLGSLIVIGILYRKRNHFYQADAGTRA
ncbi:MAG TPA: hypothetical protein VJQ50_01425 [Terriglobales bacterium]|jgi:hypothetical protein|nr:hypothetical protein [Terriglobales bacterium]